MPLRTRADLRPYQTAAIREALSRPASALFIDMGLGKTAINLYTLIDDADRLPAVVVGPIRVIETVWAQEAAKWAETRGLRFSLVRGSAKERDRALRREADVYLINPENTVWLCEWLDSVYPDGHPFRSLIFDESTLYKASNTRRWKALRHRIKTFPYRTIATGTPRPNTLMDLWAQVYLLDSGERLGTSFYRFRDRFFYPVDYNGYKFAARPGTEEYINNLLADLVIRLDAKDWLDLPPLIRNTVRVPLPAEVQQMYKDFERHMLLQLEDTEVVAFNAAVLTLKCRQIASGAIYLEDLEGEAPAVRGSREFRPLHEAKLDALEEILEETGSPVLVAYQFIHDVVRLRERFPDAPVLGGAAGAVGETRRGTDIVDGWNAGKFPVLILHPRSAGHGLNLQDGGHTLVFFSPTYSLEEHDQVIARIGPARRAGRKEPTVVHYLVAEGTVDEAVVGVLQRKAAGQAELLNALRAYQIQRYNEDILS